MIAYKVCRVLGDGTLCSIGYIAEYACNYAIGQRTVPKIGKLFAFATLADAKKFCKVNIPGVIYKVKIKKAKYQRKFVADFAGNISSFWKERNTKKLEDIPKPEGTIFCDWIELIEKI